MKSKDILIDSDIIKALFLGDKKISDFLAHQAKNHNLMVNPLSLSAIMAESKECHLEQIDNFFTLFTVTEITREIGINAGNILREQNNNLGIESAYIAATALHYSYILCTANKTKYSMLSNEHFLNINLEII